MSHPIVNELHDFHRFVGDKLQQCNGNLSPEDVLDEWRGLHPDVDDKDESREAVRAVKQALADMDAGDLGTPAAEVLDDLRERLKLAGG